MSFASMLGFQDAPAAPDYSPIANAQAQAAKQQAALGQEQLDWAKQQYANQQPMTQAFENQQLQSATDQDAFAKEQQQQYENTFQPEQNKLVAQADEYNTGAQRDVNMGQAQAGVAQSMDQARVNAQSQLESFGINPGSTRYAALDVGTRAQQGAAEAAAGTQASLNTAATGRALTAQAAGMGMAIPGQVEGTYAGAGSSGAGGVNAANSTYATGANAMGNPTSYMGLGNSALAAEGNTLNMGFSNAMASSNANNSNVAGLYNAAGQAIGMGAKAAMGGMSGGGSVPSAAPYGFGGSGSTGALYAHGGIVSKQGVPSRSGATHKLFNDKDIVVLPAIGDDGKHLKPHEAIRNFFLTGKHHGVYKSHAEAKAHIDAHDQAGTSPARMNYQAGGIGVDPSVSPSGGANVDDVPANLNAGEFIIPKDTVSWKGEQFFQNLIKKAREDKASAGAKPTQGPPNGRPTFQHAAFMPQAAVHKSAISARG